MSERPDNAVAIVGLGAVFPGAADATAFWSNIKAGLDAITEVTPDRWDPAVYCDPQQAGAARFYCRRGGFLGELATFNPRSFGIMPSSVDGTEPDQLLMLRAAAAALADGGALPERERVGVIVGRGGYLTPGLTRMDQRVSAVHQLAAVLSDLLPDLSEERLAAVRAAFTGRLGRDDPQDSINLVPNFAASRLANRFDLRGPAYTVDAACASSLLAVDHAVRELTSGRCDAVLAGGVHTCHHPTLWSVFTRLRLLSPGGVIRPFDAAADGTLLSEGAGAVLLKRLADAQAAGDRIYAVIRGVGVSSDGRAASMLNPLAAGQELAIRRAWAAAGVDPAAAGSLGLLEAHGTATPAGDRAELTALGRVFGPPSGGRPIGIGTVKSMIGHAMPAAGIAGLIKAAFAVHEAVLPPTLHLERPSPALAGTRFEPVTSTRPWPDEPVRRAAVSAFGFGGINAHVVLESAPAPRPSGGTRSGHRDSGEAETVLRLAAASPVQLADQLRVTDDALLGRAAGDPGGMAGSGPCRLAIVAPDPRRLALARKIVGGGGPWRGRSDIWFTPRPLLRGPEQVAFLFPGFEPAFAPRTESVAAAFGLPEPRLSARSAAGHPGAGPAPDREGTVWHAADIVVVGQLYTAALREIGITPGVLAGHSLGEWTALAAGGVLPDIDQFIASAQPGLAGLPDLVYLALGTSAARAAELISELRGMVITHDNCPRQAVVCGPAGPAATVARRAREAGILALAMPLRTGLHSPAFAPHVTPIRRALADLEVRAAAVPVWSATTLAPMPTDPGELRELMLRQLVEPVRFRELTELLYAAGIRAFVQIGPGTLHNFTDDTLAGRDYLTVATATPTRDGLAQLRRAAAALWADGLSPRFDRLVADQPAEPAAGRFAGYPAGAAGHPAVAAGLPAGVAGLSAGAAGLSAGAAGHPASGAGHGAADDGAADHGAADHGAAGAGGDPGEAGRLGGAAAAADSEGSVRLRLGVPLVRLTGAAPLLPPGGPIDAAPPAIGAVPPGGPPALAGLNALLAEAAATTGSVAAALTLAPPATPPAPVASGPAGRRTVRTEREFSLRTMPEVADYCLIRQPDGWPEDSDRFPVVPLTALLDIMGEAALELAPDRVVTGFQQVRALRWLTVAPPTRTAVQASWHRPDCAEGGGGRPATAPAGTDPVWVSIDGYASGYVLLAGRYPAAPAPDETPLSDRRTPPLSAAELYTDRWMFHGPRFAGVASVSAVAADGIAGSVLSLPARGAVLDSVGQLIGHWMQVMPGSGQNVLPAGIGSVRRFGPRPPAGQLLACVARIRELTDTELRADAEIRDADGRVWCQVTGWTTRRCATDDAIVNVRRHPAGHGLSVLGPDGWTVAFERWQDAASRELVMRLYLNAAERTEYERLPATGQRRWLLGRIAVKDAVRRSLWDRGAGPVFPAELTVAESGPGVRVLGPFLAPPVSLALSPDGSGPPCAAAITGTRAGLAIQPGPGGTVLITEPGGAAAPVELTLAAGAAVAITARRGSRPRQLHPIETPEEQ